MLADKVVTVPGLIEQGVIRVNKRATETSRRGRGAIRSCDGVIKAGERISRNQARKSGVYLRNNLLKVKDGEYVKSPDEYKSVGTHWIALYMNANQLHKSKL